MSTFSGLNTAYTGLVAARQGLNVVGQNISNVNTEGYTRQRVETSANGPTASTGFFSGGVRAGQGVSVDAIARLGDIHLDARVRSAAGTSGFSTVRADIMSNLEASLNEPGSNGISARLQDFWAGWQDVANAPGEPAPAEVLLARADALTAQIAQGYQAADAQWTSVRTQTSGMVDELNGAAKQVAELNNQIRSTLAAGGSVNELLDARSQLTTTIASLAGGSVREQSDGTVDVLIGGNAIVTGDTFRPVQLAGATNMTDGDAVRLEWAHGDGSSVGLDGGEIAGALTMLAPAEGGGAIAEMAANFNQLATELAGDVNFIHRGGSPDGNPEAGVGPAFFNFGGDGPPALSLQLAVTNVEDIQAGYPGLGELDGSLADKISQIGLSGEGSPDEMWSTMVANLGAATKTELQQANMASLATASAVSMQLSSASVSLDEENVNMLMYQHAYQGAARVMTAVDQMLDTLINRTGLVGR